MKRYTKENTFSICLRVKENKKRISYKERETLRGLLRAWIHGDEDVEGGLHDLFWAISRPLKAPGDERPFEL